MKRLGKTQKLIIQHLEKDGGAHVYIGPSCCRLGRALEGYFWEEVERSLKQLVKRGIVIEKKIGFYALPGYTMMPCTNCVGTGVCSLCGGSGMLTQSPSDIGGLDE